MSYDVSIGPFDGNYTWNVSGLFHDHIPGGLNALDGLTGKQAVEVLSEAFSRIHKTKMDLWRQNIGPDAVVGEPEFCAKYDPPNGWGSTVGALIFLGQILAACAANPRKKVRVT